MKKVSIIVCAYNEEKYIGECINSLMTQTYKEIEIIVVDDGSSDNTWDVLSSYSSTDSRIVLRQHKKNMGKVAAQNSAFEVATGEYIAICGADDWYPIDRIESQVEFLNQKDADFTFGDMSIAVTSERTGRNYVVGELYGCAYLMSRDWKEVLLGISASCGTAFFTRKIAEKIYPIPHGLPYEDRWITAIALLNGTVIMQNKILGFYRQHSSNSFGLLCCRDNFHDFLRRYKSVYLRNVKLNSAIADAIIARGEDCRSVADVRRVSDYLASEFNGIGFCKRIRYVFYCLNIKISKRYLHRIFMPELYVFRVWLNARSRYKKFEGME